VWTEFYGANVPGGVTTCDDIPHSRVRFGVPAADGGLAPAGRGSRLGDGDCDNSRVQDQAADGALHEMGIPL
jgi:hypothetical protein